MPFPELMPQSNPSSPTRCHFNQTTNIHSNLNVFPFTLWSHCHYSPVHDDVIKWKHFLRYCPFVQGIHRSPVNSPHKGQRRRALMFSLISAQINRWVNNREAGDLRRIHPHYDVTVMTQHIHVNRGMDQSMVTSSQWTLNITWSSFSMYFMYWCIVRFPITVKCCYNTIQFIMILHGALW